MNLSSDGSIQYTLTILTGEIEEHSKQLETSLIRLMGYLQRFSGNEDLNSAIRKIQDVMIAIRSFERTLALFEATNPVGWAMLATNLLATAFAVVTVVQDIDPNVYNIERAYG